MPPIQTTAYETAEYVLNLTRSIVNDAALSLAGNLLSDSQPYTFVLLNSAYRDLQEELADRGVEDFKAEILLTQIVPVSINDPAIQVNITYTGYNNGSFNYPTPFLPSDIVIPLRLWERPSFVLTNYIPMAQVADALPSTAQTSQFRWWQWREQSIWMIGATQENDLRMEYIPFLTELTQPQQQLLIPRCANAMAYLTAAKFAAARGAPQAPQYLQIAGEYIDRMCQRTARKKQRQSHRRTAFGSAQGWGYGIFGY